MIYLYIFTAFICLFTHRLFSQTPDSINLTILDIETMTPVRYATLLCYSDDETMGTYSDGYGVISYAVSDIDKIDSLLISHVNYYSIIIQSLYNGDTILVEPKSYHLEEVVVRNTENRVEKWGYLKKNPLSSTNGLVGLQYATHVGLSVEDDEKCYLKKVNISLFKNKKKAKIRLNIFDAEPTDEGGWIIGQPIVSKEDLIFLLTQKKGEIGIDLSKLSIRVPKDFFLSIEWLGEVDKKGDWVQRSPDSVYPRIALVKVKDGNELFVKSPFTNGWDNQNLLEGQLDVGPNYKIMPMIGVDVDVE